MAEQPERRTSYEVFDAADLDRQDFVEPRLLDEDGYLLSPGKHLVWGPPGAFKTWFTHSKMIEVARKGYPIFACIGEGSRYSVRDRLRGICRAKNFYLGDLGAKLIVTFETEWLDGADGLSFIRQVILGERQLPGGVQQPKPALVVIDPLFSYFSGDENSSGDVKKLLHVLDKELFDKNVSVLLVHHSRKVTKDVAASPRGSGAFTGWADVETEFAPVDGMKDIFKVDNTKQRDRERLAQRCFRWQRVEAVDGYDLIPLGDSFTDPPQMSFGEKKNRTATAAAAGLDEARAQAVTKVPVAVDKIREAGPGGLGRDELLSSLDVRAESNLAKRLEEQLFLRAEVQMFGTSWYWRGDAAWLQPR